MKKKIAPVVALLVMVPLLPLIWLFALAEGLYNLAERLDVWAGSHWPRKLVETAERIEEWGEG